MNEEEIQEALKIIKEPITVNSIEYKYFDQKNYEKLLMVYENCLWFVNNAEQFMQNLKNLQEKNQKLVKVNDKLANYLIKKLEEKKYDNDFERYTAYEDILNKLTELKGGSDDVGN